MKLSPAYLLSKQLCNPRGLGGRIVARLMNWGNNEMYDELISEISDPGERILEIGFAGGAHFRKLINTLGDSSIVGIDRSETMLKMASRTNRDLIRNNGLELLLSEIGSMPFENDSFTTVYTLNTIYFWNDPESDIKNIYRILKPGGVFILGFNSQEMLEKNGYRKSVFTFYTKEKAENLLKQAGFEIIKHTYKKLNVEDCHLITARR